MKLQRQIDSAYYERYMLSKDKIPPKVVKSNANTSRQCLEKSWKSL